MIEKWRRYSYAAQKKQRHHLFKALLWVLVLFALYTLVSLCFLTTVVVSNDAMAPTLQAGDRILISRISWSPAGRLLLRNSARVERGDLLLVSSEHEDVGLIDRAIDTFFRFFTAQRMGTGTIVRRLAIRRVMGVPGDSVSMEDFTFRVSARGEDWSLTEFERAKEPYDTTVPAIPNGWTDEFPLSAHMSPRLVPDDSFFLAADARSGAGDSRTWGTVPSRDIGGVVLLRYWPLKRFGRVH